MRIRPLGRSGLRVSEICFGAMTFGMPEWGCDERDSLHIIDRYLDAGGEATRIEPEYPGVFIDCIQGWLGNR